MELLKKYKKDRDERIEYAKNEIMKYENYIDEVTTEADRSISFFEGKIREYLEAIKAEDPEARLKTAEGTANFGSSESWIYKEGEELLEELKEKQLVNFIRTKESVDKAGLKKAVKADDSIIKLTESGKLVTADGELIEGILVRNVVTFNLKY